jgi:hypothetical protein
MKYHEYRCISSCRQTGRHDESNGPFRQFFAKAPTILTGDFGQCPSSLVTLYCKFRVSPPLSLRKAKEIQFSNRCHVKQTMTIQYTNQHSQSIKYNKTQIMKYKS